MRPCAQGGAYILSPRAAAAVSACPRNQTWQQCPNRFFVDDHNWTTQRLQATSCTTSATLNSEDLLVGACVAEAGFQPRAHPCFLSIPNRHWRLTSGNIRARAARDCPCPVSVHAVKEAAHLPLGRVELVHLCRRRAKAPAALWNDSYAELE